MIDRSDQMVPKFRDVLAAGHRHTPHRSSGVLARREARVVQALADAEAPGLLQDEPAERDIGKRQPAVPEQNGLVGLLAPFVALAYARDPSGSAGWVLAWNVLGIADLVVAVGLRSTSENSTASTPPRRSRPGVAFRGA